MYGHAYAKDIYEAIIAFKNDHPDIFWIKTHFLTTITTVQHM